MGKKKDKDDAESGGGGGGVGGTYYYYTAAPPAVYPLLPNKEAYMSWLVPFIFVMDVVLFGISMYENNCPLTNDDPHHGCVFQEYLGRFSLMPVSKNPLLGPSTTTSRLGGLRVELVQNGEWWRLISCIWLHAGAVHLLFNMVSLLFIGIRLEEEFGFWKIGPLYVLSGFGGSLMSCVNLLRKKKLNVFSVGASGALFGLLGAMLSELITNWTIYANKCASFTSLVAVTSFNLALGFIPGVDNSAHIGGFLSGFLLGFILLIQPQYGYVNRKYLPPGYGGGGNRKSRHKFCQYLLFILALITLTTGYAYGVMRIFRFHTSTHIHSNLTVL